MNSLLTAQNMLALIKKAFSGMVVGCDRVHKLLN